MLKQICACDIYGFCPYSNAGDCYIWCSEPEPQDDPELWMDDYDDEEEEDYLDD